MATTAGTRTGAGLGTHTSTKLRVLLIPFFATSHIEPFTDLAIRLATAASPDAAVEATIAVTPANVSIVRSMLKRRYGDAAEGMPVKIAMYPFPAVDGLPRGVENLGKAAAADSWRIDAAAVSDALMRPVQEALVREQSPDALVTDLHFVWNVRIAEELGVPCLRFNVIGAFSSLAMRHLELLAPDVAGGDPDVAAVPRFPGPPVRIPRTELPEFLRRNHEAVGVDDYPRTNPFYAAQADCFGLAVNTLPDLEQQYCDVHVSEGYARRAYFVGPVVSPRSPPAAGGDSQRCIDWLDAKPDRSVVYLCFGSFAPVSDAQLHEIALGLEASGKPFLWVVRAERWTPPEGWEERVKGRGLMVTTWAPQTAILGHPAVGAFVTHCGWNSVLETVVAGVPVLTWPLVFEQFITERLVTEVLRIGQRLWPHGAGRRSTSCTEHEVVPAGAVARAVTAFMCPGGPGDAARDRVMGLAAKAHAAMAEGGSSQRDLRRLVDDLVEARRADGRREQVSSGTN
ncbi:Cytokinin-O-glucosyltransferase 3 [Hordeum vulgare]|nr:Cytokinin-O-glucosyltransferase 3 [Hordeum vulgare]